MAVLPSDQDSSGRSLGAEELEALRTVIETGRLFAPKGHFVKDFERKFARWLGVVHTVACSSGTAAVHTALAAINTEPGTEIITSPVTDIGALTPILYQGAIPVFADLNPHSGNLIPSSVEARISDRTTAVIVPHLFGNPADATEIARITSMRGLTLIEDCAQAVGATINDRKVGTFGSLSTFSLQQGKHMTTGEGGLVSTNDAGLAQRSRLFVNKAWDYDEPNDHDFLALNYRLTELQGAVGLAQLAKLAKGIEARQANATGMSAAISAIPGIEPTTVQSGSTSSYWRFSVLVDPDTVPGGPLALADKLSELGIPSAPRYIKKPAFQTGLFTNQATFGESRWPFSMARPEAVDYSPALFPGTFEFLDRVLVLPWNERFSEEHVDRVATAIADGVSELRREAA